MALSEARWRKATDVGRIYPTFELVRNDVIILDIGFSDEGCLEVAFHDGIANVIVDWAELIATIENGKRMAEAAL